jgi:hypothetical protein
MKAANEAEDKNVLKREDLLYTNFGEVRIFEMHFYI